MHPKNSLQWTYKFEKQKNIALLSIFKLEPTKQAFTKLKKMTYNERASNLLMVHGHSITCSWQ
jgi:hypothetical protein